MDIDINEITKETHATMALFAYMQKYEDRCPFCGREYKTADDLKDTVWVEQNKNRRLACSGCWQKRSQNA